MYGYEGKRGRSIGVELRGNQRGLYMTYVGGFRYFVPIDGVRGVLQGHTPMEYNDNDYEGQNLHLTGEESSRSSSVLRPFALPKFDFDDSLQGHLRFDSLVENEVFLGIPSQEDNQWIEDFSRGGSAIAFSSSAAESCALPRHINVWSEATSSESVEMLLKAVGQEEMVPGENLMEESEPGDQLGSSTRQMEKVGQDSKIDDGIDHGNSSLPPAEVEGDISRSNQSAGVEGVQSEYAVQSGETNVPIYGACADRNDASFTENSGNSNIKVKRTSDNQLGTCGLVNEFVSTHVQENVPVFCTELGINKSETCSQNVAVSVEESLDEDKISDTSFVSSSCVTKAIAHSVEEQEEGCKKILGANAIETDSTVMHCSREIPSEMEPSKVEHSVKMCVANFGEESNVARIGESVSTEVAFVVEPAGGSQPRTVVFSSDTEIKQLSEGRSILHEKSSISLQGEGIEGLVVEGSDAATSAIVGNTELKQVPFIQSSDQNKSPAGSEYNRPGCHSSFEAPCASPSDKFGENNHGDGPVNASGSTVEGSSCGDLSDAVDTVVEKDNVEDGNHVVPPLVSTIDIISMPLVACEDDLDVPVHERDVKKLPFDSTDVACGGSEKEVPTCSAEGVQVDITTASLPNSSAGDYPALNTEVEDTKLTSSCVEGDELVDGNKHNSPSCDMAFGDQSKETESEAPKQLLSSASKESLESNELTPVFETEKGSLLDSEAGETHTQTSSQSIFLVETSSVAMSDEGHKKLHEEMKNSSNDLIVQDGGAEAAPTEKPMKAEAGRNLGANSSTVSVASCTVEMDKSNLVAPPDISCTDLSQSVINSQASLKRDDVENIAEVLTTSKNSGVNVSSKDDGTFTFDIRPLGGSPSTCSSQTDPVEVKEVSHVSSLTSPSGGARGSSERKPRRSTSRSGKASATKGNQVKEKTPLRQTVKWEKSSQFLSPLGAGQLVTFESAVKPRGSVSTPTSSLPDLNTSAPSSAFFQQPFTDLQQLQLRAQIFVYGSLIQGAAPDEACMVSAFGAKALDQTKRQGFPQSEAFTSVGGRASNKATPPVVNPMISLSSPLWNTSTPSAEALPPSSMARSAVIDYQAVSPLNPYQTPPIRNYATHTTWSSQAPFPVPWLAPSQTSSYDISTNPAFPAEPVMSTPSKESSLAVACSTKHVSSIPTTHTGASITFAGPSSLDLKKLKVSTEQTADTMIRKRKKSSGAEDAVHVSVTAALADTVSVPVISSELSNKGPAVEDLSQFSLIARNQGGQMPTPVVSSHYSTSVSVATPSSLVQKGTTNQFFSMVLPSITSDQSKGGDLSIDKRALNIECFSKVEEAKFQAQEAAAHAAAAISQCEDVWSQLGQQNNSGLTSDAQSKLASAAVAIAAAASVAKAAAAAAKIASTAALQAKQMADEAVAKSGTVNPTGHDAMLVSNSMNLANASPVSILRGGDRNNVPSLAISAAREASKKRIEAASAATRHAENLDAIVKAAELAAEAVSHAGKIVAMGEPFSLSELAEAGPNSYWKVSKVADDKTNNISSTSNAGEVPEVYMNQHNAPNKDMHVTRDVLSPIQELSRNMVDDHVIVEENIIASGKHGENFKAQKDKKVSDSANIIISDPDMESRSTSYASSSIKEGSYVEVLKDRGDLKKAWFSANVLGLKDGEALVSYTELQSDGGSEKLKEWVSIEANDSEAPKVRIPHPMTAVQFEGTRKRRRAAAKDYTWSVGDKVDAWVQDCWREGIIAEKNKNEATTLSVHFPAQGETSLVKVWHLRPTLIWSDGQWIEWCGTLQDSAPQGDTPAEKRPKLGGSRSIEAKGKAKVAKNMDFAEMGRNEVPRLPLSANEKTFSIGSMREENKPNTVKTMRSGTEKEGSRVVFGVPKPGKKRKFMEVSKHYVSDRVAKTNVPNDSVKLAKILAPHGSGSRGFKNKSKLDLKDKQVVESRPRAIKSGKPPSIIPSRSLARRDDSTSSRHNARSASVSDTGKGSISNDENESGEQNRAGFGSFSNVEETSGGSMVFSSQALPKDNRKKTATRNIKPQRLNQGKLAPASGRSAKNEANETSMSDASEPRRSNRRIQPTSREIDYLCLRYAHCKLTFVLGLIYLAAHSASRYWKGYKVRCLFRNFLHLLMKKATGLLTTKAQSEGIIIVVDRSSVRMAPK
ncbi:hypothetical protein PHJA_000319900 [Phtheirospermum japonicum]|uniref:Agenet domain-containing protein n=1 Tax=Phtheirospermum japonicum TaxID=374723 RepID=A0A830B4H3_9LAMI|nr:hypothetical protein PHJA_000319900 [Phtheirospermum japonicum]